MTRVVLVLLAALLSTTACSQDCGDVGGTSGVALTLTEADDLTDGDVDLTICQDGHCDTASSNIYRSGDDVLATFDLPDLADSFDDGEATLSVAVRQGKQIVRLADTTVDLQRSYPNGKDCDGDGYLFGEADLNEES